MQTQASMYPPTPRTTPPLPSTVETSQNPLRYAHFIFVNVRIFTRSLYVGFVFVHSLKIVLDLNHVL